MEQPTLPMFSSLTAECEYWKLRSQKYLEELMEIKKDYDEFIKESHNVETEMDATLDQKVRKIKELTAMAVINEREREDLKARLNTKTTEMSAMAKELSALTHELQSTKVDVRILEQTNDDLEQAQRVACESKETVENLLFDQYEKIAMLEVEVEEKRVLEEELQRLRDEIRDLRQELKTRDLQLELEKLREPVGCVTVASQAGDGEIEIGSVCANFQCIIRKTVGDMVSKLDNLQAKLRAHRERSTLPHSPPSSSPEI